MSGYEEYKVDSSNPLKIDIQTGYEAIVFLENSYSSFTLSVISESGYVDTKTFSYSAFLHSFRVQGSKFSMTTSTVFTFRVGVWLIKKDMCDSAVGIMGDYVNYSIKFYSESSKPSKLCIFPIADENSYKATIDIGSKMGTAYYYTDRYITGKTTQYKYCENKTCYYSMEEEDQWFMQYTGIVTSQLIYLNYTYKKYQVSFSTCNNDNMQKYGHNMVNYGYSNTTYFNNCIRDFITPVINSFVKYIIIGVVLVIVVVVTIIVLVCCWPCIVACCCAASAAQSTVSQPLQASAQYSPQYQQSYQAQYPAPVLT